jgi:MscS family membrane protein
MNKLIITLQQILQPQVGEGYLLLWVKEILGALIILGFFWILSQAACLILNKWGRRLTTFTSTDLDDRLLERVIPHVSRLFIMLGAYLAIRSLPLHEKLLALFSGLLFIILVIVLCSLIYHVIDEFMKWLVSGKNDGTHSGSTVVSRQMIPVAEKIISLFLMGSALIVILKHFNYDIFSLVTALGIGSLAIGMAAKDTLAHMISGFTLMLDRPFQIGDRIKLANDKIGDVIDIGLRSTKIQGLDSTVMIIPNSDLCNSTVINLVRPTTVIQGKITVGVGYDSDIVRVKEVIMDLAASNDEVVQNPPPQVFFTSFGDCTLNLLFLFWVNDPTILLLVTDQLNCSILKRFREEKIEIPFPIRTVILDKTE